MIALAANRLMFYLRLALVAALAGYMLPIVSFAMHGDVAASYSQQMAFAKNDSAHSHDETAAVHDHGDQAAEHEHIQSNQDCCSNLCLNMAVVADSPQLSVLRTSIAIDFTNDQRVFAEPIGLIRPPCFLT